MPLIKSPSDEARSENIRREIRSGRDPKQAAAIAYSEQRRMKGKKGHRKTKRSKKRRHRRSK